MSKPYAKLGPRQRAVLCLIDAATNHSDVEDVGGLHCGPRPVDHSNSRLCDQRGRTVGRVFSPAYFSPSLDWCGPNDTKTIDGLLAKGLIARKRRGTSLEHVYYSTENGHVVADTLVVDEYPGVVFFREFNQGDGADA